MQILCIGYEDKKQNNTTKFSFNHNDFEQL